MSMAHGFVHGIFAGRRAPSYSASPRSTWTGIYAQTFFHFEITHIGFRPNSMSSLQSSWLQTGEVQRRVQEYTTAQQEQLVSAAESHILIVVDANGGSNRLLLITDIHHHRPGVNPPHITVLEIPCYTPESFIHYQRHGPWYYAHRARHQPYLIFRNLQNFLNPTSQIILRPTNEQLREFIYPGRCGYAHCNQGLVMITTQTVRELNLRPTLQRMTEQSGTLCSYCMCQELFERHEWVVYRPHMRIDGDVAPHQAHAEAVNARRMHIGYPPLGLELFARLTHPADRETLSHEPPTLQQAQHHPLSRHLICARYQLERCPIC